MRASPHAQVQERLERELQRVRSADPFAVLGLDHRASAGEIRAAFLRATKQWHPNRFARQERGVVRLANEIFLVVKQAYTRLADEDGRKQEVRKLGRAETVDERAVRPPPATAPAAPAPTARVAATTQRIATMTAAARKRRVSPAVAPPVDPIAEVHARVDQLERDFEAGKEMCARKLWQQAQVHFQKLAVANPHERRFRLYMHYAWARDHQSHGRDGEAIAELRRALNLDADFAPARRALSELAPEQKPKGFLSKLFGK